MLKDCCTVWRECESVGNGSDTNPSDMTQSEMRRN